MHQGQRGRGHLFAWLKDDRVLPAPVWHEGTDAAAACTGLGLDPEGGLLEASHVAASTLDEVHGRFHGEWSACRLAADGSLAAATSPTGTEHVYFTEQPGFTAISNRGRLLWAAMRAFGQRPVADLNGLATLVTTGYSVCSDATAVEGVQFLGPLSMLEVPAGTRKPRRKPVDPALCLPSGGAPPDWDAMAQKLQANVRGSSGSRRRFSRG